MGTTTRQVNELKTLWKETNIILLIPSKDILTQRNFDSLWDAESIDRVRWLHESDHKASKKWQKRWALANKRIYQKTWNSSPLALIQFPKQ